MLIQHLPQMLDFTKSFQKIEKLKIFIFNNYQKPTLKTIFRKKMIDLAKLKERMVNWF